jgi:hypothetical protein
MPGQLAVTASHLITIASRTPQSMTSTGLRVNASSLLVKKVH